jgi:adenosylcobyric acid synthase
MKTAKNIMVQGTASSVGKSIIAAGLCRILAKDGYKTAPFKSQNMALNSYVTLDGKEMGRAQAMQALAAGVEPEVEMNPILLKPVSHTGSQVVLEGKPIGNYEAEKYFEYRNSLKEIILKNYNYLAAKNDVIVIEGAGSPAEINLRENDVVNTVSYTHLTLPTN